MPWDIPRWYHFFDMTHHRIDNKAFKAKHIAQRCHDDMLNLPFVGDFLKSLSEVFHDKQRLSLTVIELMFKLVRRIERININKRQTCTDNTDHRNRILQNIRHHHRHFIALDQSKRLQISGDLAAIIIHITISQRHIHASKSNLITMLSKCLLKDIHKRIYIAW